MNTTRLTRTRLLTTRGAAKPKPALQSRRRRGAVAVGVFAVAFVVLQLGLAAAAELSFRVRDPAYGDKEKLLARATAARGRPLVVMLGSSRTSFAFHAFAVEERLAAEFPAAVAFNFGVPASGPVTHALYLRRLVEQGHRPDLLLVEVLPPMFMEFPEGPMDGRFLNGNRLRYGEAKRAVGYGLPPEVVAKWRSSVVVPWSELRLPLLGRLTPSALPWGVRFDWGRSCDARGWGPPPWASVTPEEYRAGVERARREYAAVLADLRPAAGAVRALHDLLALCRDHGIPAKLVLLPEAAEFRALYSPVTLARLDGILGDLRTAHGCDLIDARDWGPPGEFTDGHHLLRGGAKAFSDRLARDAVLPFLRERRP